MAESTICAAEVMAKAVWESYDSHVGYTWENYKREDPSGAELVIKKMRAALRAFGEMCNPIRGERRFTDLPIYEEILAAAAEGDAR